MTRELLLAFVGFAFVTSVTPGPNNTMLLASGANYGFVRSLPHMLGVSLGCLLMLVLVGLGLGGLLARFPMAYTVLRYVGAAYLLLLAWKIARSGAIEVGPGGARPMRMIEAAAFQWVNPKAWVMVVGAITTYTPAENYLANMLVIAVLFTAVNIPTIALWTGFGTALRGALATPGRTRVFNIAMALLLVGSLYPILMS